MPQSSRTPSVSKAIRTTARQTPRDLARAEKANIARTVPTPGVPKKKFPGTKPFWEFPITQGFGPTDETLDGPYAGYPHFNKGNDYAVPENTPLTPIVPGKIVNVSDDPENSTGWGKFVWVRDSVGNIHRYNHLNSVSVKMGDTVDTETTIGLSGNTGKSTGPHVSLDISNDKGEFVDPTPFVGEVESDTTRGEVVKGRKPTTKLAGNYEQRVQQLLSEMDDIQSQLDEYEASNGQLLEYDPDRRIVGYFDESAPEDSWQVDSDGNISPPFKLDSKATALFRKQLSAKDTLTRLITARKEGAIQSGEDSAKAYLGSEKEKSGEAARAYNDYSTRLSDMSGLENQMLSRANALSDTYRQSVDDRNKTWQSISQGELPGAFRSYSSKPTSGYDYKPHVANIARSLPREAPGFRPITPDAVEPYQFPTFDDGSMQIPQGPTGMSDQERIEYYNSIRGDIGF